MGFGKWSCQILNSLETEFVMLCILLASLVRFNGHGEPTFTLQLQIRISSSHINPKLPLAYWLHISYWIFSLIEKYVDCWFIYFSNCITSCRCLLHWWPLVFHNVNHFKSFTMKNVFSEYSEFRSSLLITLHQ